MSSPVLGVRSPNRCGALVPLRLMARLDGRRRWIEGAVVVAVVVLLAAGAFLVVVLTGRLPAAPPAGLTMSATSSSPATPPSAHTSTGSVAPSDHESGIR